MQPEQGTIRTIDSPFWSQTKSTEPKSLWTILACLTTCQLWKHRCCGIFQGKPIPPTKIVMELWDHLIAFFRGSYEDIQGETDSTSRLGATFILKWRGMSMLRLQGGNIQWCYLPSKWLFPPRNPPMQHPPLLEL